MLEIIYSKGGEKKSTSISNADMRIKRVSDGNDNTVTVTAKTPLKLIAATRLCNVRFNGNSEYFLNGYQSWTETREFSFKENTKHYGLLSRFMTKRYSLDSYGDGTFYEYRKDRAHGYDVFYVKGKNEYFSFNNNYKNAYLIYEVDKKSKLLLLKSDVSGVNLAAGEEFTVFDYSAFSSVEEGLKAFNEKYPLKGTPKIFGYTSWYNYYQDINADIINRDLDALDDRFDLFQIDDGYETFVGDWLSVDKNKFPDGLKPIVDKIHKKGFKAGIWLAPFVAEEKSRIFTERKDLFAKRKGEFVKCGINWSGFYSLDFYNPEAREYIARCLKYYVDLGFDFFKLDFLYGVNLPEKDGKTRSMVAEEAYAFLREILKGKIILGCGATPFNCIDKFDYLRVGPDVSLKFDDAWYMKYLHRERVSTKVTLQNTVFRSFMGDRLFGNDPDVFLLRSHNLELTYKQRKALSVINALFGQVLMTSDNISDYFDRNKKHLAFIFELFTKAKVESYKKRGKYIDVVYRLDGEEHALTYDTRKGEFINE